MSKLLELWSKSPARVVGVVQAILLLLISFGLPITQDQTTQIIGALAAVIVLFGGAEITRSQVYSPNTIEAAKAVGVDISAVVGTPPGGDPSTNPVP